MYIEKQFHFDSAHILPRHKGKCGRLHGHTYCVTVGIEGSVIPETQFVIDYGDLKEIVKPIIDLWDHRILNSFIQYPSAENIATHLAWLLRPHLQFDYIDRWVVKVSETPETTAIWDSRCKEDVMRLANAESSEWGSPNMPIPIGNPTVMAITHNELVADAMKAFWEFQKKMTLADQVLLYQTSLKTFDEKTLPLFPGGGSSREQ